MLRLIAHLPARLPAPVHIAGLRLAHAVRTRWWRIARRPVRGCRVLVIDPADRVLLIRHSYGNGNWMLPGGGMAAGEAPVVAAIREVYEETACRIAPAVTLGRTDDPLSPHETHLVAGWTQDHPVPDGREVVAAAFFAADALPPARGRWLDEWLEPSLTAAKAARPADRAALRHPG